MSSAEIELLIRAGRVVCPGSGRDGAGVVALGGTRIVAADEAARARQVLEFPDGVVLPGLVDLHAHPAPGGKFGVDPDVHLLPRGTTTVLSQGDAGVDGAAEYAAFAERVRTRVRWALNLARRGEAGPGPCFEGRDDVDAEGCRQVLRAGPAGLWGLAFNISPMSCPRLDPRWVFEQGLRVADEVGRPILFGSRRGADDFPLAEQLRRLRAGDVVTYCFHGLSEGLLDRGRIRDCVWEARARGVLFDVGHGRGSFDFEVAEAAIRDGFLPDTISTDFYAQHVDQAPPHDLPAVMSKLRAAGMPEAAVFQAATSRPAEVLGDAALGVLRPGACGDLTVLHWTPDADLTDTRGHVRRAGCWTAAAVIRAGELVGRAEPGKSG